MHFWMLDFSGAQEIPFSWMFPAWVTIDDELLRLAAILGNGRNKAKKQSRNPTSNQVILIPNQPAKLFTVILNFTCVWFSNVFLPFSVRRRGCCWTTIPYPVAFPKTWGNLSKLILLDLSNNRFEGAIFSIAKRIQRSPGDWFFPQVSRGQEVNDEVKYEFVSFQLSRNRSDPRTFINCLLFVSIESHRWNPALFVHLCACWCFQQIHFGDFLWPGALPNQAVESDAPGDSELV